MAPAVDGGVITTRDLSAEAPVPVSAEETVV
jgi:hypothetical protein